MFELKKMSAGVPVSAIEVGHAFELNAEIFIRLKKPTQIGNVQLKLSEDNILCVSLETWQLTVFPGNTEVVRNHVTAQASISYE